MFRFSCVSARTVLALAVTASILGATTPNITFSDIPANHWAKDPVYRVVNQLRVAKGYPDGTFRGDEKVSRYETVTYINNLSLAMENMMDQKLRTIGSVPVSSPNNSAMRQELDELKTRLNAMEKRGNTNSAVANLLQDSLTLDIFWWIDDFNSVTPHIRGDVFTSLQPSLTFKLNSYGLSGYEILWINNVGGLKTWTARHFTPDSWVRLDASLGHGQLINPFDQRVIEIPDTAIGLTLGLWGLELGAGLGIVDTEAIEIANGDNRLINKTTAKAQYTIPIPLPLLNIGTLGYAVENYYPERDLAFAKDPRTLRYHTNLRFDFNKEENRYFETRAIKEWREVDDDFHAGHAYSKRKYSQYYEASLNLGDLFKSGTNISMMASQKDLSFGMNGMGEKFAGVNLLGYSSGDYLLGLMPFADIVEEFSIKVTQDLYRSELLGTVMYLYGRGLPMENMSSHSPEIYEPGCMYVYNQYIVRLDWFLRPGSSLYLEHEQVGLTSSFDDPYTLMTNRAGVRIIF